MHIKNKANEDIGISVIIPAYNEESHISNTITALKNFAPDQTEIIVVDNGSTDLTPKIAEELGAKVIIKPNATISKLRNTGVKNSNGKLLVFIDADVSVTQEWGEYFVAQTIDSLLTNPYQITGSRCLAPSNGKLLNTHWFNLLTSYDAPYINSGHLITTRELFDQIKGFTEELKTAEDYDFCMKAKEVGAALVNEPKLTVIHYGYPETIKGFINRERWHGKEDFQNLQKFIASKVAIIATLSLIFTLTALTLFVLDKNFIYLAVYFVCMFAICLFLSIYKFRISEIQSKTLTAFIFYLYLIGRSLSLVDRLKTINQSKTK